MSDNTLLSVLATNLNKHPCRLSPFHRYLQLYYTSQIKEEFLRRFALAKEDYKLTMVQYDAAMLEYQVEGNEQMPPPEKPKKPEPVRLRTEIGTKFWNMETEELQQEVTASIETQYTKEMKAYENLRVLPKTPLQFHQ